MSCKPRIVVASLSFLCLALLSISASPELAEAGVLLRSQRVSSRVNTRAPRVRLGRVRSSTQVARRLNPIGRVRSRGGYSGVSAVLAYRERQAEYQKKLYKFELKQAKKQLRLRKKQERRRERALRKKRRELERKLAKLKARRGVERQDSEQSAVLAAKQSGKTPTGNNVSGDRTGAKSLEGNQPRKKRSFWSKLWLSLIGKGSRG